MNNNETNFNDNPQMKILNNLNNQKNVGQNQNEILNVIPTSEPIENNQNVNDQVDTNFIQNNQNVNNENGQIQNQNTFINNPININNNPINNINNEINNSFEEENPMLNLNQNKFIVNQDENQNNNLNNMNVNGEYFNMPKVDYSNDPKVRQNIEAINKHGAKNTIKIGSEGKVFLIIVAVLLIFIIFMPTIYDAIRNIR